VEYGGDHPFELSPNRMDLMRQGVVQRGVELPNQFPHSAFMFRIPKRPEKHNRDRLDLFLLDQLTDRRFCFILIQWENDRTVAIDPFGHGTYAGSCDHLGQWSLVVKVKIVDSRRPCDPKQILEPLGGK